MHARCLVRAAALATLLAFTLAPDDASATDCVWGSFDASRINYANGPLTGSAHVTLRTQITNNGDTVAAATPTLTSNYLDTVDIFYTSLLNTNTGALSNQEQTALQNWIAGGGTLIVSADIFPLPAYESFTAFYGVTGYASIPSSQTATTVGNHPLIQGVTTLPYGTTVDWSFGNDALELATNAANTAYLIVMEPGTGFNAGGRVAVFGDHNTLTESGINSGDTLAYAQNLVAWACAAAVCGDGELQGMETCDDGNGDNTDDCLDTCEAASCGDGFVWADNEACDDGNGDNTDDCLDTCEAASCGDGFLWTDNEACDDGNVDDDDDCPSTCAFASCGDGFVWADNEACDDGNGDNTDACLDTCEAASCGDGFVWADNEACDDGNDDNADACLDTCEAASCGDGFVWTDNNEECDDGNAVDGDGCESDCTITEDTGTTTDDSTTGTTSDTDPTTDGTTVGTTDDSTTGDTTAGTDSGTGTGTTAGPGDSASSSGGDDSTTSDTTGTDSAGDTDSAGMVGDDGCGCTQGQAPGERRPAAPALALLGLWGLLRARRRGAAAPRV